MERNKNQKNYNQNFPVQSATLFARVWEVIDLVGLQLRKLTNIEPEKRVFQAIPVRIEGRHETMIRLMNQGKRFDDAHSIMNAAEEWDLDLHRINASDMKVRNQSVWIDLED